MKTKRYKIISIVLLMVFFSQQVSWACGYNLSLLVNPPPSSLIYKDHGEFNRWVARRVYSLAKPSFRHNPQDLKSAYQWLKTPATETVPCSAYVLYNLLQAKGIKPKIEDISASLISLDLKAGNLKPPFIQNRIDNSLYAMAKTAESQGLTLYPARLNSITSQFLNSQTLKLLNSQTPFIAHLSYGGQSGHFVLVTKIDTEKVYFFYDKGDTFLPVEKFLEEFSGYCLLSSASVGTAQCAVPTIADSEAKTILGAGRSYHGRSVNISGVFKKPSSIESVIGIASSIGGAFFMPAGNLWATAAGAGIQVGGGLLFKDSMWGRIATGVAAGAVSGGLSGSTFKGALGLSWGFKEAGIGAAKGLGMSGTIEGIKAMNFGDASLRASIANLLAIPVGQAIEGGLSAKFGATIDGIDYKKETSGSFWKGAWMGATFQRSLTNKADGWKRWAPAIAYYGGQSASIAVEAFGPKKYSSLYSTGISTAFNALTNVAAMEGDKLWKVLGKSVADGALRGGLSIGLQKLTKDMRVTEGAFLEMAGASLISAGVESAFGKWSGDSAVSRKGIFWDNLQKSWKGAMQDVVTFGADKGYMLGTRGAYAFLKMSELGANVGKARASGLSAFDSAHWAFNQHVGSTYHNAAVNTLSNTVWNRVSDVKYVYGVGYEGTKFITKVTQRELNKALSKNNAPVSSVLAISVQNVEKGVASSLEQEIKEGLKSNPNSLELQAAKFALTNGADEHAYNALMKYQVYEIDRKIEYQGKEGTFGNGPLSPQDILDINIYGESAWLGQMNQQKEKIKGRLNNPISANGKSENSKNNEMEEFFNWPKANPRTINDIGDIVATGTDGANKYYNKNFELLKIVPANDTQLQKDIIKTLQSDGGVSKGDAIKELSINTAGKNQVVSAVYGEGKTIDTWKENSKIPEFKNVTATKKSDGSNTSWETKYYEADKGRLARKVSFGTAFIKGEDDEDNPIKRVLIETHNYPDDKTEVTKTTVYEGSADQAYENAKPVEEYTVKTAYESYKVKDDSGNESLAKRKIADVSTFKKLGGENDEHGYSTDISYSDDGEKTLKRYDLSDTEKNNPIFTMEQKDGKITGMQGSSWDKDSGRSTDTQIRMAVDYNSIGERSGGREYIFVPQKEGKLEEGESIAMISDKAKVISFDSEMKERVDYENLGQSISQAKKYVLDTRDNFSKEAKRSIYNAAEAYTKNDIETAAQNMDYFKVTERGKINTKILEAQNAKDDSRFADYAQAGDLFEEGEFTKAQELLNKYNVLTSTKIPGQSSTPPATSPQPPAIPGATPVPAPISTPSVTTAAKGDYLSDLKKLQDNVELTLGAVKGFLETSKDKTWAAGISRKAEMLSITPVEKEGEYYYKIDAEGNSYLEALPPDFRNIEFPSKELAEAARYLCYNLNNDKRMSQVNTFKGLWDKFSVASEELSKFQQSRVRP